MERHPAPSPGTKRELTITITYESIDSHHHHRHLHINQTNNNRRNTNPTQLRYLHYLGDNWKYMFVPLPQFSVPHINIYTSQWGGDWEHDVLYSTLPTSSRYGVYILAGVGLLLDGPPGDPGTPQSIGRVIRQYQYLLSAPLQRCVLTIENEPLPLLDYYNSSLSLLSTPEGLKQNN